MKISILSIFPECFTSFLMLPLVKRAINKKIAEIEIIDIKEFAGGSFRHIDDSPCGGGKGMLLRVDTVMKAIESVSSEKSKIVLLSPKGKQFNQDKAREYSKEEHLVLVAGHYEGFDKRIENHADELISIGPYILSGGETGAMVVTDSIIRLLDGIIRSGATEDESFEDGLLEYPQYTKPIEWNGERVPEVLLSGNHQKIEEWKREKRVEETKKYRPDLWEEYQKKHNS